VPQPAPAARGLSAGELQDAAAALHALAPATVVDVVPLRTTAGPEDLLLVLQPVDGDRKVFVHVALGSSRARIAATTRRFAKATLVRGPVQDLLHRELAGCRLVEVVHPAAERRCELVFAGAHWARRLVVELFGSRGLWALLGEGQRVLALSRTVETAVRSVRTGDAYQPPPAAAEPRDDGERRFAAPVLPAIDAFYAAWDLALEFLHEHERLSLATRRALQKARGKVQGMARGLADAGRAQALRTQADLMLAFAGGVPRGASEMSVPDPEHDGGTLRIELDPARPVVVQAQALYDKARRLDAGRAITEQRHREADAAAAALAAIETRLQALTDTTPDVDDALAGIAADLQQLGALPKPKPTPRPQQRAPAVPRAENYRRFVSAEGYEILVGRDNEQNDRLTMRTAKGNDLWLHVGGGRAGSHVVVRLPKQKTASLETLLDAGTLAVHFSKARG
jgi:predicted ribosome quality control (RQC) complex YloA/Tae2 family protein